MLATIRAVVVKDILIKCLGTAETLRRVNPEVSSRISLQYCKLHVFFVSTSCFVYFAFRGIGEHHTCMPSSDIRSGEVQKAANA